MPAHRTAEAIVADCFGITEDDLRTRLAADTERRRARRDALFAAHRLAAAEGRPPARGEQAEADRRRRGTEGEAAVTAWRAAGCPAPTRAGAVPTNAEDAVFYAWRADRAGEAEQALAEGREPHPEAKACLMRRRQDEMGRLFAAARRWGLTRRAAA